MKSKKIIVIFSIVFIILIVGGFILITYLKNSNKEEQIVEEYIPQEEISEEQSRQTIVSLYFPNKETQELEPEARLVDIKEILENPYEKMVNLLIEGPKDEAKEKIFPENTKLLNTTLDGDCLILNFSTDFLSYDKTNEVIKDNLIKSIVNTLTQLNEVNKIKFLIDGNESEEFNQEYTIQNVIS